jgi:hypothetical protein
MADAIRLGTGHMAQRMYEGSDLRSHDGAEPSRMNAICIGSNPQAGGSRC